MAQTRRRKRRVQQKGGEVFVFKIYIFTKSSIQPQIKKKLFECLKDVYGKPLEENIYTGIMNKNHGKFFLRNIVKDAVKRDSSVITEISVKPIPPSLKHGKMSETILQEQMNILELALEECGVPFKVIQGLSNLWANEVAMIVLEPSP